MASQRALFNPYVSFDPYFVILPEREGDVLRILSDFGGPLFSGYNRSGDKLFLRSCFDDVDELCRSLIDMERLMVSAMSDCIRDFNVTTLIFFSLDCARGRSRDSTNRRSCKCARYAPN